VRQRWGPGFWLPVAWLTVLVVAAIGAPWLAPNPDVLHTTDAGQGPSWQYPFGTSAIGHDLLERSIHGARLVLIIGLGATVVGLVLGGVLGLVAGYRRGWLDTVLLAGLDAWVALPGLMSLIAVVTYIGRSPWVVALAIGLLTVPLFARVTRTAVISVTGREYVLAARMLGATHRRILRREVLPNVAVTVGSYALVVMGLAVVLEGALSFLGFGLEVRKTTWGLLMLEGERYLDRLPYLTLIPALLFLLTVLSLNLLGDQLAARYGGVGVWRRVRAVVLPARTTATAPAASPPPTARTEAPNGAVAALAAHDVRAWLASPAGAVRAVDGVTFAVAPGRMLAVVGESGSGKTMLARTLLGVLPPGAATSGSVTLDGRELLADGGRALARARGREIAMVFQDPSTSLDPVMKVGPQIAEMLRVHRGAGRREARREAVALLEAMGINDPARRARQYPHELSGGVRQRVAVARALAGGPSVLIADEPTSALDVTVQAQLLDLLAAERAARNLTVVLITHDLGIVANRADEVAVMYAGRIVEQGPTAEVFRTPRMPYTAALLAAVPRLDTTGRVLPTGIGGQPPNLVTPPTGCAFAPRCAYASDRCREEAPTLTGGDHAYACHHPLGLVAARR
jgi:peptide/nickel transport system permease protein